MAFIQLTGGAYQSRSLIAAAQRCLNLFPERMTREEGEPVQVTHYCTPGLTLAAVAPQDVCRCLYTASNGDLWSVYGQQVLWYDSDGAWHVIGSFQPSAPSDALPVTTPVYMADNGEVLIIVDGSVDGWVANVQTHDGFTRIDKGLNTGWYGADYVSFQDTFFLFNKPGTPDFYISLSQVSMDMLTKAISVDNADVVSAGAGYTAGDVLTLDNAGGAQVTISTVDATGAITNSVVSNTGAFNVEPSLPVGASGGTGSGATFNLTYLNNPGGFDPLDFAGMTAQVTRCVAAVSAHRNVWLIGETAHELWINTGGSGQAVGSFPFQLYPEAVGNWGCAAKHSIATIMNEIYWLSQDKFGRGMVMRGTGLQAKRISTHAIEVQISQYADISDAIGFAYQQQGHVFYVLSFPSANSPRGATWVFDGSTEEWHERCCIIDPVSGAEWRHLGNACAAAYNKVFVGDWRNGNLYTFDLDNYTDNGLPIKRLRSFPHQIDLESNRRIFFNQCIVQMQVGAAGQGGSSARVIDCDFDASDGTLLEDYSNINSIGATFTKIDSTEAVIIGDLVTSASAGDVLYSASGVPDSPDYYVRYNMVPVVYDTAAGATKKVFAIGRANASNNGYKGQIGSDGTQYLAQLIVMGGATHTVNLGTGLIASGYYQVTLNMTGTAISLSVMRSEDGRYVDPSGAWVGSPTPCISLTDSTYTAAGDVLLGGHW